MIFSEMLNNMGSSEGFEKQGCCSKKVFNFNKKSRELSAKNNYQIKTFRKVAMGIYTLFLNK